MAARVTKVSKPDAAAAYSQQQIRDSDEWEDHFQGRIDHLRDEGKLGHGPIPQDRWEEIAKYADEQVRYDLRSGIRKELTIR